MPCSAVAVRRAEGRRLAAMARATADAPVDVGAAQCALAGVEREGGGKGRGQGLGFVGGRALGEVGVGWTVGGKEDLGAAGVWAAFPLPSTSTAQRPVVLGEIRNTPGLLDSDDSCADINFDVDEFKLRTGTAVRTLRRELPLLFEQDLTYDIYADDITLRDAQHLGAGSLHGKQAYKGWAATLRRFRALFFHDVTFSITGLQLLPRSGRSETCGLMDEIVVRWCVQGTPRMFFAPLLQGQLRWDGQFKYTLNSVGLIEEHVVDNRLFLSSQKPMFSAIPVAIFAPPAVAPPMGPARFSEAAPTPADQTG